MKDRLITLLGAVIALYILFRLLVPQVNFEQQNISFPTSEDRGKYGLAGLYHWLDKQHVPVYSLRERYGTLQHHPQLAERGNLLIISLPLRMDAQFTELQQLQAWIKSGNNALLLVSMSDWPQWASRRMGESVSHVLNNFDLEMIMAGSDDEADQPKAETKNKDTAAKLDKLLHPTTQTRELIPGLPHPITAGIHDVQANWLSSEGLHWHLEGKEELRSSLILLRDQADGDPALWLNIYGAGKLLITRHSDLFGNVSLGLQDNAKLFSNITQQLLGKHGKVIFDDMHQGLSVIYDPEAFFHDPRLHHTLLFLLALWLVYVMGHSNRFGQIQTKKPTLQLREHVQAIGNLFARRLHSSAVAARYAQHFFNEVRSYYSMPLNGQPVWEQLQQNAAIELPVLQRAQHLYQRALNHKRVNLVTFVNTLKTIRRELT